MKPEECKHYKNLKEIYKQVCLKSKPKFFLGPQPAIDFCLNCKEGEQ